MADETGTMTAPAETTEPGSEPESAAVPDGEKDAIAAALAKANAEAKKYRLEAKALAADLEGVRQQSMTESEKAIAAARAEARAEALREAGTRLVDAEVRAAAAGRPIDVKALLDGLDRSRFLDDEGQPDTDKIARWVDKIAPSGDRVPPARSGPRNTGDTGADMNSIIRRQLRGGA